MLDDFNWFVENYRTLYLLHGRSFLAIKGRRVIRTYRTYAEAVSETAKKEPLGTFIVQECNGDESAYTALVPFCAVSANP